MLQINNLAMMAGHKLLFEEVNLNLLAKRRYGLVGANGTGKSTLLRILSGHETPVEGELLLPKLCQIGFLKQDQYLHEDERTIDVVLQGKPALWEAYAKKNRLLSQSEWTDQIAEQFAKVEETIARLDGYSAESFAHTLLTGLGIAEKYHFADLKLLSGGMKIRVLLAQALFAEPDVLLLDEPTNHLDLMTIIWLEKYLINQFPGLLIFISHDRDFLNHVATDILDIDYGEIKLYTSANYDKFIEQKKLFSEQKLLEQQNLEIKIKHLQSFVDRFKAKASKAKQAQSRQKMIDKIELPDIKKSSRIAPNIKFAIKRPSGKLVLTVQGISKIFSDRFVLENLSFKAQKAEKIAIIGHNGIGKSTLLKIINGILKPDLGVYEWGYETHLGYFAQDHHEQLTQDLTVIEWLMGNAHTFPEQVIRNTLGQLLFQGDDVYKKITTISGGEAARLLLANIMLAKPNVLILDEPTNHLDLESIDALSLAVQEYPGTLFLVSHDRHFVSQIATRILAITEKGLTDFLGTYPEFIAKFGSDFLSRSFQPTLT